MDLVDASKQSRSWACYDCGKCTSTCPIARAGGQVSPRRHVLDTNLGDQRSLLNNGSLFSCLTCSQCERRCPAEVAYTGLVQQLRELAYSEAIEPQCPHGGALHSLMRMMARGGTEQDRLGWLDNSLETAPETGEVFYWTGCTVYYDAFFPELEVSTLASTKAAVQLLNRLGITPVVSRQERCCGHDLLWNGDRASFEALAAHNVALMEKSGAKTLVTSCAECLRTWKLDYAPHFSGKPPEVFHIAELLAARVADLPLSGEGNRRVTFQDPCRLGRHLGIYEPPRQLLAALPGVELIDMRHHRDGAQCCAGGTWSHCDRVSKVIQVNRLREARSTGAEVMVTACPKCQIHFRCAMKDPNLGQEIEIEMRDIAELVSEALT